MVGAVISVVLAHRHEAFAEGLAVVLDGEDDLVVFGTASDEEATLELLHLHSPTLLLLDAELSAGGLETMLRGTRRAAPATHILVLSGDASAAAAAAALAAGADGFLTKQASARQVVHTIRAVANGQRGLFATVQPPPSVDSVVELRLRALTPREWQTLGLIMAGYSNRRIAEECGVSLRTARKHVQNVFVKLGVHSRLEAAAFAVGHQVVLPNGHAAAPNGKTAGRPAV